MDTLSEKLLSSPEFLFGVELVSVRGSMAARRAVKARDFARELVDFPRVDWVSITDNAGGNPQLAPHALGKPILYAGKEVVIHMTCKDLNRNGLESQAWFLNSEGFHNILAMTGDYPVAGMGGLARPVFDIDSVGLITMLDKMNRGFTLHGKDETSSAAPQEKTHFLIGAVTTNFKLHEGEVIPQLLKLQKKVECGARFIINQVGYDARKMHELRLYMDQHGMRRTPLIGNVYVLNPRVAGIFNQKRIPGVVVTDELLARCLEAGRSADAGKAFFLEFAAKQAAIYRGLGYRGVYLGGVHKLDDVRRILEIEKSFSPDDWKTFAREINYARKGEFFYYEKNEATGLADSGRESTTIHARSTHPEFSYRFSKWVHRTMFEPERPISRWGAAACERAKDPAQGPALLRIVEHMSKAAMFACKDCGDCSLPETAYLCPESQCAKNQRNGPCGGTREGRCEVDGFGDCIWLRAYERRRRDGTQLDLLQHAPMIQNQGLRNTSAWANHWLGRDHAAASKQLSPAVNVQVAPADRKEESENMHPSKLNIIGELMNNSYGRARNAFKARDPEGFQRLAVLQSDLGADFLTLNIDGTQNIQVRPREMLDFLPDLVPAIQEVTSVPLSFDNPSVDYHRVALAHYDRKKSGRPILNSIAASRERLAEMIELVKEYDTMVIVMASEMFRDGGTAQCLDPEDAYAAARYFVERLVLEADRTLDQIIIDPGLAPVGADTYGLVNVGLDAMRLISEDPDIQGVHLVVGLSNFAWGTPRYIRESLERAYLTLGMEVGLDFALANPEKTPAPLPADDPLVEQLREALAFGRAGEDESQEMAGFRQAEAIMNICRLAEPVDE